MTTTSLSIMHQVPAPTLSTPSTMHSSLAPSSSDLRASIPIRTSSIRSKPTIIVNSPPTTTTLSTLQPSRPTSRCSSVHSTFSVSGSLDHRTMTRTPAQSSLKPRPVHTRSSSLDTAKRSIKSTTATSTSTTTTTTTTTTTATTASFNERSAFLNSAPVRSRVQIISPRFKNMSPAASANSHHSTLKFSTATTGSATSLPSSLRCCPLSMGVCCALGSSIVGSGRCGALNLHKRRWSNDSTRGLHGTAAPGLLLHALEKSEDEDEDALSGTTIHDEYFNDNDNSHHKSSNTNCNNNNNSNNNKTKNKKRCPTLAWFNFLLRK